jgi:hypothetical protein
MGLENGTDLLEITYRLVSLRLLIGKYRERDEQCQDGRQKQESMCHDQPGPFRTFSVDRGSMAAWRLPQRVGCLRRSRKHFLLAKP